MIERPALLRSAPVPQPASIIGPTAAPSLAGSLHLATPGAILGLQRSVGNRAVCALLAGPPLDPPSSPTGTTIRRVFTREAGPATPAMATADPSDEVYLEEGTTHRWKRRFTENDVLTLGRDGVHELIQVAKDAQGRLQRVPPPTDRRGGAATAAPRRGSEAQHPTSDDGDRDEPPSKRARPNGLVPATPASSSSSSSSSSNARSRPAEDEEMKHADDLTPGARSTQVTTSTTTTTTTTSSSTDEAASEQRDRSSFNTRVYAEPAGDPVGLDPSGDPMYSADAVWVTSLTPSNVRVETAIITKSEHNGKKSAAQGKHSTAFVLHRAAIEMMKDRTAAHVLDMIDHRFLEVAQATSNARGRELIEMHDGRADANRAPATISMWQQRIGTDVKCYVEAYNLCSWAVLGGHSKGKGEGHAIGVLGALDDKTRRNDGLPEGEREPVTSAELKLAAAAARKLIDVTMNTPAPEYAAIHNTWLEELRTAFPCAMAEHHEALVGERLAADLGKTLQASYDRIGGDQLGPNVADLLTLHDYGLDGSSGVVGSGEARSAAAASSSSSTSTDDEDERTARMRTAFGCEVQVRANRGTGSTSSTATSGMQLRPFGGDEVMIVRVTPANVRLDTRFQHNGDHTVPFSLLLLELESFAGKTASLLLEFLRREATSLAIDAQPDLSHDAVAAAAKLEKDREKAAKQAAKAAKAAARKTGRRGADPPDPVEKKVPPRASFDRADAVALLASLDGRPKRVEEWQRMLQEGCGEYMRLHHRSRVGIYDDGRTQRGSAKKEDRKAFIGQHTGKGEGPAEACLLAGETALRKDPNAKIDGDALVAAAAKLLDVSVALPPLFAGRALQRWMLAIKQTYPTCWSMHGRAMLEATLQKQVGNMTSVLLVDHLRKPQKDWKPVPNTDYDAVNADDLTHAVDIGTLRAEAAKDSKAPAPSTGSSTSTSTSTSTAITASTSTPASGASSGPAAAPTAGPASSEPTRKGKKRKRGT